MNKSAEQALLHRLEQNMKAKFAYIPNALISMDVTRSKGALVINSHLSSDMFNIICCEGSLSQKAIQAAIEGFQSKSLPAAWWVGFSNEESTLRKQLEAKGFSSEEAELTMVADLLAWQPHEGHPDLEVTQVENKKTLHDFIQVLSELMSDEQEAIETYFTRASHILLHPESRLKLLVGYLDKKPVATSSVFLAQGLAGIFDVITLPVARGQGVAKTMTTAAMKIGHAHGYAHASLGATNDARYLYEKLGFNALSSMEVYPIR